jgi:hypothetical protein
MKQRYKTFLAVLISIAITFLCTAYYVKKSSAKTIVEMVIKVSTEMDSFNDIGRVEAYDFLEELIKKGCNKEALDFINYQKSSLLSGLQSHMKSSETIKNTVMERNHKVGERAIKQVGHKSVYEYPTCK